ncbi:1-acyl-sn-glycerol-3-phosphate acyltransferase [Phormidium sp. CLA17]|uniref:1-acyl-sn-glycerol-3-phosphate acyltransferase n=1 Tax=Leptolyngbya sp. Cla-17 TaxID=2803751 RepID=UPI001490BD5B|nr:1-acyl-sn-glycerol-3-phosphate acyltransferase [Leptolyngbya sp. Cla-17]MBM0740816.1 1-acyl-sn-glycerol-3-phosphate acyltransferase [Leptolyngbya sp. Cla-17]
MPIDFYPPRRNVPFVRLIQMLAPLVAPWGFQMDLEVEYESLNQLIALRNDRVLLMPNHPTFHDVIAIFLLSGRLGQSFYYLGAYEQLQSKLGRFFQAIGCYSVRRGLADRPSIIQTMELLAQPGCHLVIFPEGGCSFQNDIVTHFRTGAVQLAFQAINRVVRQGNDPIDLYAVPVSIKYRYTQDMTVAVEKLLTQLEQKLKVPTRAGNYQRLRAIAETVLTQLEQDYGMASADSTLSWNQRIKTLKAYVLQTCEQQYGLTSAATDLDRERVYRVLNAIQTEAEPLKVGLQTDRPWTAEFVERSMRRVLNFDAMYDGYVAENPTLERFMDTLIRLEREVFNIDQPAPKGHRVATLKIGAPINLKDSFTAFQTNKIATVNETMQTIQRAVQTNLDLLNQSR